MYSCAAGLLETHVNVVLETNFMYTTLCVSSYRKWGYKKIWSSAVTKHCIVKVVGGCKCFSFLNLLIEFLVKIFKIFASHVTINYSI